MREAMRELALFAGAGGGILGGIILGWRTVCAVEIDPFCREVLLRRQMDGFLPRFPIWDDVRTFDGRPWRGCVDVISGGFPCQDISAAGKGEGITGKRSGLWKQMARIVGEVRPLIVFVENSPLLIRRGLAVVLGDLAEMGYDARWCCVSAADCGAPHIRDRVWILAHTVGSRCQGDRTERTSEGTKLPHKIWHAFNTSSIGFGKKRKSNFGIGKTQRSSTWWPTEPNVVRVVYGLANRVDRIRALGNGQVPRVAATAWRILNENE